MEKNNIDEQISEKEKDVEFGSNIHDDELKPTPSQYKTLKHVAGHASMKVYLICFIEFAERASYYGVHDRLYNFIQLPLPKGGNGAGAPPKGTQQNAGALNMGLQAASGITLMLTFLAYLTPLFGGYISDKKLGRVKTIWYGIWIGALSHVVLIIAAIPSVLKHGSSALAPTIIAIVLLAIGSGLIKPNLLPLLFDQYPYQGDVVKTLKSGKQVIFKRSTSLETMALFFYWAINIVFNRNLIFRQKSWVLVGLFDSWYCLYADSASPADA